MGSHSRSRSTTLRTARLLIRQFKPIQLILVAGLTLLVCGTFAQLVLPTVTGHVMDSLSDSNRLWSSVRLLVLNAVVVITCQALGTFLMLRATEDVVAGVRRRSIGKILRMSMPVLSRYNAGDLISRVTTDAGMVRVVALQSVTQLLMGVIMIVGSLVMMYSISGFLLMITLCAIVPPVGLLYLTTPRVKLWAVRTQKATGDLAKVLERAFSSPATVKANTAEHEEEVRLVQAVNHLRSTGVRTAVWRSASQTVSMITIQFSYMVVLSIGGVMVINGRLEVSQLIPFLMYATQLSAPALTLTQAYNGLQTGAAALERLAELDAEESERLSAADTVIAAKAERGTSTAGEAALSRAISEVSVQGDLNDLTGATAQTPAVVLDQVRFAYPASEATSLQGLSMRLERTGLYGIVGPSGCGKSSVLRLLEGFHLPDGGRVEVFGRDVRDWALHDLRRSIAFVEQEAPVLEGSARQNLLYGNEFVTTNDAMMQAVLTAVRLDSAFDGLDDEIGYRGSTMSGGERQRLALARALLRDPQLLLLDEATSALDNQTEAELLRAIRILADHRCVVMVAHRLGTVKDCDQIFVLEDGMLRAQGTHTQLLGSDELYTSLVQAEESKPTDQSATVRA